MTIADIKAGALSLRVSTNGGIVLGFWQDGESGRIPLLREAPSDQSDALASGCYPLVPFGNRVSGNRFSFGGKDYVFEPNTDWDRHYLHGEGWQSPWSVTSKSENILQLAFSHRGSGTPYSYDATQVFTLSETGLEMRLTVENKGSAALPFGLGWHPYFPLTPETTLTAPARKFWTEVEGWLPGEATAIPQDLDFSSPAPLPKRWVNNGFEGWSGEALVSWPERRTQLRLTADPLFRHAFVFVSDTTFDPAFKRDYFCFEPMSHLANGHNLPGLGDLTVLEPGAALTGAIRLHPEKLAENAV
ncbi:aldose 1-epimerase [Rhizobium sp. P38BS-XIX]|uniref:aldose 1-epimerase n=1 Tax=Rhizobium sp. P38BS-XIX TaxID=2726740 RepID=UPI001456E235|nr:aldose 1-epimerase [Rhizobium sp. P38BS-XIX]NLR98189.1 aldose 1-epimerase [Rhizobium sp. P38BS-XIX]